MKVNVGILALQGDIEEHRSASLQALKNLGVEGSVIEVKDTDALKSVDAIIIPGGESTVMGSLSTVKGVMSLLREKIMEGLPALGTCAGMIVLANRVYDRVVGETKQNLVGVLDIVVERNSFGRQNESFERDIEIDLDGPKKLRGVFIRAPTVKSVGERARVIGVLDGSVVAVRQGNIIATSFHPELSNSTLVHEYLVRLASS